MSQKPQASEASAEAPGASEEASRRLRNLLRRLIRLLKRLRRLLRRLRRLLAAIRLPLYLGALVVGCLVTQVVLYGGEDRVPDCQVIGCPVDLCRPDRLE